MSTMRVSVAVAVVVVVTVAFWAREGVKSGMRVGRRREENPRAISQKHALSGSTGTGTSVGESRTLRCTSKSEQKTVKHKSLPARSPGEICEIQQRYKAETNGFRVHACEDKVIEERMRTPGSSTDITPTTWRVACPAPS
jgi:hypothetical protein